MTHPANRGLGEWLLPFAVCAALVLAGLYGCGGSEFGATLPAVASDAGASVHTLDAGVPVEARAEAAAMPLCPPDDGGNPWANAGPIPCPAPYVCRVPAIGYECLNGEPDRTCLASDASSPPPCATQPQCEAVVGHGAQCSGGYCRLGCQ